MIKITQNIIVDGVKYSKGQALETVPENFNEKFYIKIGIESEVKEKEDNKEKSVDDMTVSELKAYAEDKGIELESTKKDDIISEIKIALEALEE